MISNHWLFLWAVYISEEFEEPALNFFNTLSVFADG